MLLVPEVEKRGELAIGLEDHVSAFPPIAAIGSPPGNILFAAKAEATVTSISSFDEDFRFIDEFDRTNPCRFLRPSAGLSWAMGSDLSSFYRSSLNADLLPIPVQALEGDDAVDLGKEREIFPHPDICSRMDVRAPLPNQDRSGENPLSPKAFHSQSLTGAVAAVPRTSLPLFVSHRTSCKTAKNG
jgi:hypothetical protein